MAIALLRLAVTIPNSEILPADCPLRHYRQYLQWRCSASCGGGSWCVRNSLPRIRMLATPCAGCFGRCDDAGACNLPRTNRPMRGGARGEDSKYCVAKNLNFNMCGNPQRSRLLLPSTPRQCIRGCPSGPLGDICRCLKLGEGCYVPPPVSNTITRITV